MFGARLRVALVTATALAAFPASVPARADGDVASVTTLDGQFRDPPASARPRVWWHWMNGNITKDGIAKDIAWMKRVGIGGLQNFDANIQTPRIVDKRLVYMTPEWRDAFRFAVGEAERQGLELAIASSPGWSETGGPWVDAEDGMKKLVWSETIVAGERPVTDPLAQPPGVTGAFQSIKVNDVLAAGNMSQAKAPPHLYRDVAVLAVPMSKGGELSPARVETASGVVADAAALTDDSLETGIGVPRGTAVAPGFVSLAYAKPQTARSATLYLSEPLAMLTGATVAPQLEVSDNRKDWRVVATIDTQAVPTTVSFAPVTARYFRVVLLPRPADESDTRPKAPGVAAADYRTSLLSAVTRSPIKINELRLLGEARVDRFETKAGFGVVPDFYALSAGAIETGGVAPEAVVDLSSHMRADGTLDWIPPAGRWRILRLGYSLVGKTNHPAPEEATGLEVDKYDGAAVKRYLDHYLQMYRNTAGADMVGAKGVRALLTDSIEVGAANWTPRMIERFRELRGYDPLPWLPALTGTIIGSRADSDRFLYDFRRTLADLLASDHYGTVAKVAHDNGLIVYGEALEDRRPMLGNDMAMRSHADIPMSAMWTYPRGTAPRPTYLADIKGAASVAHIYGRPLVAAESLTASQWPWAFGPADLKPIIDLEFVTGVNRPVIHTSVHQPVDDKLPGLSLFQFGQYFNRHEAWAEMAKPWVDYMARNAFMLQQGRNVADVAYFFGEEAPLTGLYGDKPVSDAPHTMAYDFIDADALTGALSNDGDALVTPGGARYRLLYLGGSSRRMTLPTLKRIAALVEGGATVVGAKPEADPSLGGNAADYAALVARLWPGGAETRVGKGRVIAGGDVEMALASIGVAPDFRFTGGQAGAEIPFVHRKLEDGDSYFLVNRKAEPEVIEAHFRVTGKAPELWHAETGQTEAVSYRIVNGETIVPLSLDAEQSVHVVFRKRAPADALAIKKLDPVALGRIDGAWTVRFQPGRGAPAVAALAALGPLNENADPGIRYFSGIATYAHDFEAPRGWRKGKPLWIDLGDAREIAEVSINGQVAGTVWHAPYRVDIGHVAKPGRNRIEVRVANLWVNRLIGDAQPSGVKITWTSTPAYRADAPLRPSGLLGPVEILGQR